MAVLHDSEVVPVCCGQKMEIVTPSSDEQFADKHVPVIYRFDNKVEINVGKTAHPMTTDHHIEFIILETTRGFYLKKMRIVTGLATAKFILVPYEKVIAAYSWCNIHGMYRAVYEDQSD